MSNGPRGQGDLARLGRVNPRSTAGRRIQAAFSREPVRTPGITNEKLKEIGERVLGSPEDQGRQLFELLSDDNKRRAIRGELPDDYFSPEKMQALREYIESSGITVESYFAEVETMPVEERRVREAVAGVGLAYDENASVDENARRAADVALESIDSGRPITAVAAEYVAQAVEATGIDAGTRFRERISVLTEPSAPTQRTEVREEPEPATRLPSSLPPSDRLDTMGARPELTPEIKSANTRNRILREQREYDAEVARRTRLEENLAAARMRAEAIERVSDSDALERARLTARNMRVRGRGDAKASFEEGMAARVAPVTPVADPTSRVASDPALRGRSTVSAETVSPEVGQALRLGPTPSGVTTGSGDDGEVVETPVGTTGVSTGGVPQLTAAQIREANQAEVEALLAEQFGGFSFFLQKHNNKLQVGLTADGEIVAADDPNAVSVKNVLDVIVEQGITAPTRVLGIIQKTEWFQTTDRARREYDVLTADMSEPEKTEYLEPVLDTLREEAQFLGMQLDPTVARELAEDIKKMGEENDSEYIRGTLIAESGFVAAEAAGSSFAAAIDEIMAMSKRYFTPIDEAGAAEYAQNIYIGTQTVEGVERMFREQAAINYPQLENSLNAGFTPEQYFAPYKYEIERMLDRPNVDLYEEFGDVIQFIPDTGTGESRPMTLGEVRKYVRGLDEWQQSSQAKQSARSLSFAIGNLFGEVA